MNKLGVSEMGDAADSLLKFSEAEGLHALESPVIDGELSELRPHPYMDELDHHPCGLQARVALHLSIRIMND